MTAPTWMEMQPIFVVRGTPPKIWTPQHTDVAVYREEEITFNFGVGLDLRPGHDQVKIVPVKDNATEPSSCNDTAMSLDLRGTGAIVTDLGPDENPRAEIATARFLFPREGEFMACYKLWDNPLTGEKEEWVRVKPDILYVTV